MDEILAQFVMENLIDPAMDLVLCRKNFRSWSQNRRVIWLQGLSLILFLLLAILGLMEKNGILMLIGFVGTFLFGSACIRYTIWWYREGRYE